MYKKILIICLLLTSSLATFAEFRWGPTVGLDVSTMHWRQKMLDTKYQAGFNAGMMGELMIPGIGFGIDMALKYDRHGAKVNFGEYPVWSSAPTNLGNENVWLNTVQLPINLRFKWTRMNGLEEKFAPLAYAGPLFTFNCNSTSLNKALEHPAGTVSIQFGLGAELFEHFQITAGYYFGVSYEVRTVKLDNFSARPQGWLVNAAWLF